MAVDFRSSTCVATSVLLLLLCTPVLAEAPELVLITADHIQVNPAGLPASASAFGVEEIGVRRLDSLRELQVAAPALNYSKNQYASFNLQLRGVGSQLVGADREPGIATVIDGVSYVAPPLDGIDLFDLQRIEVLQGPQSVLQGRSATGGALILESARPDLTMLGADLSGGTGNYGAMDLRAVVNIPILSDTLALRMSGAYTRHDGFVRNLYPGAQSGAVDGKDVWALRGSLRWKPNDDFVLDVIGFHAMEVDSRLRAQELFCQTDPSGILGCLPNQMSGNGGVINLNATIFNIPVSKQANVPLYGNLYRSLGYPAAQATALASSLGIVDLSKPFTGLAEVPPADARAISTDANPRLKSISNTLTVMASQKVASGLTASLVAGYGDSIFAGQQNFSNVPGPQLDVAQLEGSRALARQTLQGYALAGLVSPAQANFVTGPYAFFLDPSRVGQLPVSRFDNLGVISGAIQSYRTNHFTYDQSEMRARQVSIDARLNGAPTSTLRFVLGAQYMRFWGPMDYYIGANAADYGGSLMGALLGPVSAPALCATTGCVLGPTYLHRDSVTVSTESQQLYGEVNYDLDPEWHLTAGLRAIRDVKRYAGRASLASGFIPLGRTDETSALNALVAQGALDFDGTAPGNQEYETSKVAFGRVTTRLTVSYMPDFLVSSRTLFYAAYSQGYKAGGANAGLTAGNAEGLPALYKPEALEAFEVGAKTQLLADTLQLDLSAWHYRYKDYQYSSLLSNRTINANIDAELLGLETKLRWTPVQHLGVDLSVSAIRSRIGDSDAVDARNPTGGQSNALLIKDATMSRTSGNNCALYYAGAAFGTDLARLQALSGGMFFAPPGGTAALAGQGIPNTTYGSCYRGTNATDPFYAFSLESPQLAALLRATNFLLKDPRTGAGTAGVPTSLKGNMLPGVPPISINLGTQYELPLADGYKLTGRMDWYWRAQMYGRIFNDGADRISGYVSGNLSVMIAPEQGSWSLQAYVKNVTDGTGMNGMFVANDTLGLFTAAFYNDPRLFGLRYAVNL